MAATITWGTLGIGPPIPKVKILKSTLTFGPKIKEYSFPPHFSSFRNIFRMPGLAAKWMYMYKKLVSKQQILPRPLFLKRSVRIWHQFLESQGQLGLKSFSKAWGHYEKSMEEHHWRSNKRSCEILAIFESGRWVGQVRPSIHKVFLEA